MFANHKSFSDNIAFAGGSWTFAGPITHNNISIGNSKCAIKSCLKYNIDTAYIASWGDDGKECSFFGMLPTFFCFAEFSRNNFNMKDIKEKFNKLFGLEFDDFMKLDEPDRSKINRADSTCPSKYLFYNDLFLGIYDTILRDGIGKEYHKKANMLKKYVKNNEYGYIFDFESKLCSFMEIKAELGKQTRALYNAKNIEGLKNLLPLYKKLPKRLDACYEAFRYLWYKENKSFGFEVQDIRYGGLKQRIINCTNILENYINGKIDRIEELEQELFEPTRLDDNFGKQIAKNRWVDTVTACPISQDC